MRRGLQRGHELAEISRRVLGQQAQRADLADEQAAVAGPGPVAHPGVQDGHAAGPRGRHVDPACSSTSRTSVKVPPTSTPRR
ncbi:MAG TPA: hypothetical protein VK586_00765 [Streptosporangiaceae bacterium]|nr:hypothetical protein [Streptosporangiaceae bacterium]